MNPRPTDDGVAAGIRVVHLITVQATPASEAVSVTVAWETSIGRLKQR